MVALLLTVLMGFAAVAVDTAKLRQERRELQNGADAAALAVAKDCAAGSCLTPAATANTYADLNASDNAANISAVCGSGPGLAVCSTTPGGITGATGWVYVSTTTHNPGNAAHPNEVDFTFAPAIGGGSGGTVEAHAIAAWGPVGRAQVLPLIFSSCEFSELGGSIGPPPVVPAGERLHLLPQHGPSGHLPCRAIRRGQSDFRRFWMAGLVVQLPDHDLRGRLGRRQAR